MLGAGQFFTCAFLATDPPPRRLIAAQLAAWNGGIVLTAAGLATGHPAFVDAGAAAIFAGLVLFALGLRSLKRRSLQRVPWALRWYQAAAACLALGGFVGVLILATGVLLATRVVALAARALAPRWVLRSE